MTTQEEWKAKKLEELEDKGFLWGVGMTNGERLKAFLSQTIDELWALPEKKELWDIEKDIELTMSGQQKRGWNACIAEAERMRDLSIKRKV
jgi:hypothetical protein